MHYTFETSNLAKNDTIASATYLGELHAKFELRITKIRNEFKKMDKLIASYDPKMLAHMSTIFDMSKPLIARDILEAKNLLLELQIAMRNQNHTLSQLDINIEQEKIDKLSKELEEYQTILLQ